MLLPQSTINSRLNKGVDSSRVGSLFFNRNLRHNRSQLGNDVYGTKHQPWSASTWHTWTGFLEAFTDPHSPRKRKWQNGSPKISRPRLIIRFTPAPMRREVDQASMARTSCRARTNERIMGCCGLPVDDVQDNKADDRGREEWRRHPGDNSGRAQKSQERTAMRERLEHHFCPAYPNSSVKHKPRRAL